MCYLYQCTLSTSIDFQIRDLILLRLILLIFLILTIEFLLILFSWEYPLVRIYRSIYRKLEKYFQKHNCIWQSFKGKGVKLQMFLRDTYLQYIMSCEYIAYRTLETHEATGTSVISRRSCAMYTSTSDTHLIADSMGHWIWRSPSAQDSVTFMANTIAYIKYIANMVHRQVHRSSRFSQVPQCNVLCC